MSSSDNQIEVIAGKTQRAYLSDLWSYRELWYILSWRDIKVRYKQTIIGGLWALIRPLLTMLIFSFVFGRVAGLAEQEELPYDLIVLTGVLPWQLIASIIAQSGDSLIGNERLITKVYFPRVLIPAASIGVCLLDFLISLFLLLGLFVWFGYLPVWTILLMPIWLVPVLAFSAGLGFFAAALNVRYRDVRYALPFALQLGLFLSPVGFSSQAVPNAWQFLYQANPAVGIIESFRWGVLGASYQAFPLQSFTIAVIASLIIFYLGYRYFRATERYFADFI